MDAYKETRITPFLCMLELACKRIQTLALFKNFIIENFDLQCIMRDLKNARHLEFVDCNFMCLSNDLCFSEVEQSELKSITIRKYKVKISEADIMLMLNIIVPPLSRSPVKDSLEVLYVPKFMNAESVKSIFDNKGFQIQKVYLI